MTRTASIALGLALAAWPSAAADWPEWRGPRRDGTSSETGLPARWSPAGENLAWKAPFGARSAPVVVGDRLYIQSPAGKAETAQERVVCLNADTGRVIWEHRFEVFHTDVPAHRIGWASPSVDSATGVVFSFGVHGELRAISPEGKLLWSRSLTEEYGAVTTHGGRTVSPVVEDGLVIVSTLSSGWGAEARGNNRYFAFDAATGEAVWVSSPQVRHYDTNYSTPAVGTVDGRKILVVGGSDGAIHALEVATGAPVWKYEMSKRAILTSVVLEGRVAFLSHSEENYDTSEMGQLAALDVGASGEVKREQLLWRTDGAQGGFASPVVGEGRLYLVDNGANLVAFDAATGRELWKHNLGTIQKASPVLADGKLYVGTENGKFFILKPRQDGVEVLDQDWLGSEDSPEQIIGSVAVARGRVYLPSMDALYAIGPKTAPAVAARRLVPATPPAEPAGDPVRAQLRPAEVLLAPSGTARFRLRLYDAKGRFVREEATAAWSLEGLEGELKDGAFSAPARPRAQAGLVKATAAGVTGSARVRVLPASPWSEDFDALGSEAPPPYWINSTGKFALRERDGGKALVKLADNPLTKRGRLFFGAADRADSTVEADVLATEKRRQLGDAGVIAQRYALVLFGNGQKLEIHPWQANAARTVSAPFAWKPETWYRLKLSVRNLPDGTTRVQGKAWPSAEPEPQTWTVEKLDRLPHRHGAPGLYADAPAEVFFDRIKVESGK